MRLVLAVLIILFSSPSFSDDYYWTFTGGAGRYPSAVSACNAAFALAPSAKDPRRVVFNGQLNAYCMASNSSWGDYNYHHATVVRGGTGCTDPKVYNPETGECEAPPEPDNPCADKVGQSEPFSKTGSRGDGFYDTVNVGGKNMGLTPDSACLGGCTAFLNQFCVFTISANRYSCSGRAYYTGEQCTAGPTSIDSSPTVRDEEPEVTNDEEPCVYVQDAEGRSHCVSKQSFEQEGQNCGTAGPAGSEQVKCFPKEAKKDESKIETEVTEKPTPDGGKETVKKDVHTETKCTGNNQNCTTTVTTTTTTTKADGSGKTTSTTVTCKGPKCGEDGKGGGGGGGGGNGSGEGEEEGGGDLPGNDDVLGFGDSLGSFTSKIQGSPIVGAVGSISFPDGGSCNMPSANVYMLGTISFDWFCQNANILDALYYVMLGVWALGAVRLFLEA
jgi:hypothetical protein|nr:hypothetical protein [Pseudomonas sp. ALS1279]